MSTSTDPRPQTAAEKKAAEAEAKAAADAKAAEEAAAAEAAAEPTMGVHEHFATPAEAVPVSGMLEDDPSLIDEQLTAAEWDAKLDAYSKSPRP